MGVSVRSLRSAARLGIASGLAPLALWRGLRRASRVISVDIFGTLLCRVGDEHTAWREGTTRAAERAQHFGIELKADPLGVRRRVERRISEALMASGADPEFPHEMALLETLKELGASGDLAALARELAEEELGSEIQNTGPVAKTAALITKLAGSGVRVVLTSDTRYTAAELERLLAAHGITGWSRVYASADYGASKFSGRLFDIVVEQEHVKPSDVLHIGDNLLTDLLSPAQRGFAVRPTRTAKKPPLPEAPFCAEEGDSAFALGYRKLGPVLAIFTTLLFQHARRDRVRKLAFVARDGELLFRVAQEMAPHSPTAQDLELRYVHLSRRSVACASEDLQNLNGANGAAAERVINTLLKIRGMGTLLDSFVSYYNIPAELVATERRRLGLAKGDKHDVEKLLGDAEAMASLAKTLESQREKLLRYLLQEKIMENDCALVDIGWRGSLQKTLQSQARHWERPTPRGYYLGMWDEGRGKFPAEAVGLISDQRQGRSLKEGSAWHTAFLLESVCRAKHGIVVGYEAKADRAVTPVHVVKGGTREAEQGSEQIQSRIQQGILAYARWFASTAPKLVVEERQARERAQQMLLGVAFFPRPEERAIGHELVYSEPTSDEKALSLITRRVGGLSDWIAGLRSPWKGGYLRENGGLVAASLYCLTEWILSVLPQGAKPLLRKLVLRDS